MLDYQSFLMHFETEYLFFNYMLIEETVYMMRATCSTKYTVYKVHLTLPSSWSLVSITTMVELCSHNIRQKSSVVICKGPCVAM